MTKTTLAAIFQRYLDNSCTPEELDLLLTLMSDPQHSEESSRLIRDQMQAGMELHDSGTPEEQAVLNYRLELIMERIDARPVRILRWKRWLSAAAVLLLLGSGIYFLYPKPNPRTGIAATTDLPPGQSGAILTLADGSTLPLDSLGNGVVAVQGATQVVLQKGAVKYNAGATYDGQPVFNSIKTPRARQFKLVLPDGTTAWLNAASSVQYPTAFNGPTREVTITGEVYFEVAHHAARPFRVHFEQGNVEVLGTHFNINAYADEPVVKTTLLEGRVKINAGGSVVLRPGQQARISAAGALQGTDDVDTEEETAWKDGKISLSNASMAAILRQISRWYDVEVRVQGRLPQKEFNGIINRNVNLSSVLGVLEEYGVNCQLQGNVLVIL